jgi:valyl-tRNA synthetase
MAELSKTYDPKTVEPKWYARWIANHDFEADAKSSKPAFSIVIPPPNVTGVLTLGHVLNNTIQDILVRRARMQGFETLWLPGTDHAGIGTQTAVEKHLRRTEKKTRHDLGREEFLRRVLDWQAKHGGIIIEQLKRLGCSCDWSRERYTFDDAYVRAVLKVFVDLYQKGLIYRGRRMINWDPAAQTALSDEEVISKPQKGNLYYVRYEIVEEPGRFLEVATTRPETIMADVAMAFHPGDRRYVDLIGKHAWRPLAREKIPIITDEAIDPEFGTGVLKVTPAHDKVDFEVGQRHKLPVIDVLHPDGKINCPSVPELNGLDRFEARKRAAELLQERGLLSKTEPYENNVGFSDRSEVPIEPRLSEQWFLRYPKTKEALAVVKKHLIRFFPKHWEKVYAQWLENIQDWCISRQVWWGHRIPAWYRNQKSEVRGQKSEIYVGIEPPPDRENWRQDEDTLDTWFSSWLWAYETMDEKTRKKFYPTSVLVTAPDIIFFWVARMIIAGLEFKPGKTAKIEDNIPFHDVFFTGIIRDKQGRKMSKSLGNSPDPLDLIDKYGADALRIGVVGQSPIGHDIFFEEKDIETARNFCTKLWNSARFRQLASGETAGAIDRAVLTSFDKFILSLLSKMVSGVSKSFQEYEFAGAWLQLAGFFWHDFCDWYLEAVKPALSSGNAIRKQNALAVIDFVFSHVLRLMHPFVPFITAELWQQFGYSEDTKNSSIITASWPEPIDAKHQLGIDIASEQAARNIIKVVNQSRGFRAEFGIPSNNRLVFVLKTSERLPEEEIDILKALLKAESLEIVTTYDPLKDTPMASTPLGDLFLILAIDRAAERDRLDKEIAKIEDELETVKGKLKNKSFVDRAPAAVVEEHRQRQKDFTAQLKKLKEARNSLN